MLSYITVRNFGCFDDDNYTVKFNKLNVIVGTNNSGKSTLFKGLNMIRWITVTGNPIWNTRYFLLQNFNEAVYAHDTTRQTIIESGYINDDEQYNGYLQISRDGFQRTDFRQNGSTWGISDTRHQDIVKKIWYFSPNRTPISYRDNVGAQGDELQPLLPSGQDIKQYLIERWTAQDHNWEDANKWFKKIDPQLSLLKTPLYGNQVGLETERDDGNVVSSINLSLQGSGMQNIATIIASIIFSPQGNTIIIEEPENFLNSRSIEILVDLFNYAVNSLNKQIIICTHSWEIINAYCSDIGEGTARGSDHIKANSSDFKLIVVNEQLGSNKIQDYNLEGKKYTDVRNYFKDLWG